MISSVSDARCVKQVDSVGFSLAGKVGKRERARIETLVENYIRNNYEVIRSHFATQANQGSTTSAVRLCINRANDHVTIVSVNGTAIAPAGTTGSGNGGGGGSSGGGGGGSSSSTKCYRRQRRGIVSAADSSFDSCTAVASAAAAASNSKTYNAPVPMMATAMVDCREECGATGESMDAAIEYLMARDRRSSAGAGSGSGVDNMVRERLLRSSIPKTNLHILSASEATAAASAAAAASAFKLAAPRNRSTVTSPISWTQVSRTITEETAMGSGVRASLTAISRIVGESYDCVARGAAFRQQFPSVNGEFIVFYDHGESHCRSMLTAMGFIEKSEQEETSNYRSIDRMCILWCNGSMSASKRKNGVGYHIVNRLRFRGLITNKCSLVRTLAEFEINHSRIVPNGLEASSFLPATIHLNGAGPMDVFHKIRRRGIYLIKPGYSDCGKGIVLYRSDGNLESLINTLTANYPHYTQKDLVLQKYIENPLLLNGKKFDLRVFLLMIPNQRKETGVYAFVHPGYARLACRNFDIDSSDLTLHLTNQAVQHKDKTYKIVKEETVWSPDTLNEFLNKHRAQLNVPCSDWAKRRLYPRIRAILAHLVSVVSSSLCDEQLSYELFGCDFLVDDRFNVWFLEVNSDPSLNKSTKVLRQIITQVVEEAVGLAVEVLQRAVRGMPIKALATEQDFRKVYSHTNESVQRCVLAESRITYPQHFVN